MKDFADINEKEILERIKKEGESQKGETKEEEKNEDKKEN